MELEATQGRSVDRVIIYIYIYVYVVVDKYLMIDKDLGG